MTAPPQTFRQLFREGNFRRLWAAAMVLALGDAFMRMGFLELFRAHGYDKEQELAKVMLAVSLPGLLLGPFAMAFLDRWQRRRVLMLNDALRAVLVIGIALWLWPLLTGRVEERHLLVVYLLIFFLGALTTFYYPARSAFLPNVIATDQLVKANTLLATCLAAATVGGQAPGGWVAEKLGVQWAVLANAVAYLCSVALIAGIRITPHATTQKPQTGRDNGWAELKSGLTYLRQHPTAMPLVLLAGVAAFVLGILIIKFVGYAMDTLKLGTVGVGSLMAAGGVGAAAAIIAVGSGKPWTRATWLPFGQLLMAGATLVLMSLTNRVWLAVPLVMALGGVVATVMIQIDTKLQAQVEELRRGAVFAARGALTSATMVVAFWLQFGTAFFRRTPAPTVMFWLGIGSMVAAALALVSVRTRSSAERSLDPSRTAR